MGQLPLLHNSLLPQFNNSNLSPNNNLSHNRLLLQYKVCSPAPATTILVQESLVVRRPLVQFSNNNSFLNSSLFPNSSCLPSPNRSLLQKHVLLELASTILVREFLAGSSSN